MKPVVSLAMFVKILQLTGLPNFKFLYLYKMEPAGSGKKFQFLAVLLQAAFTVFGFKMAVN
jgi:hypothetical protein